MVRVLVTGGRAPATLELCRLLSDNNHVVIMAESVTLHVSRGTRAYQRHYRVPAPRTDPVAYVQRLRDIVRREAIDFVLPTCEEIFHIARYRSLLAERCTVFCESFEIMRQLHSKQTFIDLAAHSGLDVPTTQRVLSRTELAATVSPSTADWVVKPEFSRFATEAIISPSPKALSRIDISTCRPWVAQERLKGKPLATWSVAHAGQLTAHAAYEIDYVAGGSAINFQHCQDEATRHWVTQFIAHQKLTGQFAFDFIDVPGRGPVAIECNPRLTSGIHLFQNQPDICSAFFDPKTTCKESSSGTPAMLAIPMLLYGAPSIRSFAGLKRWFQTFYNSQDVMFRWSDPMPIISQIGALLGLTFTAIRRQTGLIGASTWDIQYDGELN